MSLGFDASSNADEIVTQLAQIDTAVKKSGIKTIDDVSQAIELSEKSLIRKKSGRAMQGITRVAIRANSRIVMPTVPYSYIIEKGRKEVLPLHPKDALWWPGLAHPVMKAKAWPGSPFVAPSLALGKMILGPTALLNVQYALGRI